MLLLEKIKDNEEFLLYNSTNIFFGYIFLFL